MKPTKPTRATPAAIMIQLAFSPLQVPRLGMMTTIKMANVQTRLPFVSMQMALKLLIKKLVRMIRVSGSMSSLTCQRLVKMEKILSTQLLKTVFMVIQLLLMV